MYARQGISIYSYTKVRLKAQKGKILLILSKWLSLDLNPRIFITSSHGLFHGCLAYSCMKPGPLRVFLPCSCVGSSKAASSPQDWSQRDVNWFMSSVCDLSDGLLKEWSHMENKDVLYRGVVGRVQCPVLALHIIPETDDSCNYQWAKLKAWFSEREVWSSRLQVPEDVPYWDGESQIVLYFFWTIDEVPWFQKPRSYTLWTPLFELTTGHGSWVWAGGGCEGRPYLAVISCGFTNVHIWKLLARQMVWTQIEDPFGLLTFVFFKCLEENDTFKKWCHLFWKLQNHNAQNRKIYALLGMN